MRTRGRRDRIAEAIRKEVAGILHFDLSDPRIGRATVTRVAMSGDLTLARVYVSILGSGEEREETLAVLGRARGRVRSLLGSRVRLRVTPEVRFVFDPSVEFSIRLEQILASERLRRTDPDPGEGGTEEPDSRDPENAEDSTTAGDAREGCSS